MVFIGAQVPGVDGIVLLANFLGYAGPGRLARATAAGLRDLARSLTGRSPHRIPIVGPPGSLAAMTTPDAEPGMRAIAGPTWRNEFCAREILEVGMNRPVRRVGDIRCPVLFQIADRDAVTPPEPAQKAAWRAPGRAEVRRYPVGHFALYTGDWFERAARDQLHLLRRQLGAASAGSLAAAAGGAAPAPGRP